MLKLIRFYPLSERIELLEDMSVDVIGVKALGNTELILNNAIRLLKSEGRIILLKGKDEKPVECKGLVVSKNIIYSLPSTKKIYRLIEYTLEK
ncbi:MAG TPA: class I SAM-dependent methyltransferase [Syntrophorhabdaceae bacterium]|nr:class I SAM-dependent methyltransferase [Syntrophorhabdaceae bacterium]